MGQRCWGCPRPISVAESCANMRSKGSASPGDAPRGFGMRFGGVEGAELQKRSFLFCYLTYTLIHDLHSYFAGSRKQQSKVSLSPKPSAGACHCGGGGSLSDGAALAPVAGPGEQRTGARGRAGGIAEARDRRPRTAGLRHLSLRRQGDACQSHELSEARRPSSA